MPPGEFMEQRIDGEARPILAVFGGADASSAELEVAEKVGAMAARAGRVVLTGGGSGVMEAACRGAVQAGGLTVGILPVAKPTPNYPNRYVAVPIFTGAGSARNQYNVLSATLCVAIGGGPGTLSEIALALKAGKPVWCWKSWSIEPPSGSEESLPRVFDTPDDLFEALSSEFA